MKMFDYSKLKGRMKEKGYTQEDIAKHIKKGKCTLNLKLNNQAMFVQDEISDIIDLLEIPATEIKEYFFKVLV